MTSNGMLKNLARMSFRGARQPTDDEESRKVFVSRARFLASPCTVRCRAPLGMTMPGKGFQHPAKHHDRGVTLVETMIAILVAFVAMSSLGAVVFSAMVANKNQGTETTRMTALAQEKAEQLLRLGYADVTTNSTLVTDAGWSIGLTPNSATTLTEITECPDVGSPNMGYVDFLDNNGQPMSGDCGTVVATGFGYERRWKIASVAGVAGLKHITVVVYAPNAVRAGGATPTVSITTLKSQ